MINHRPRRLLCIDTKHRVVRRYQDKKCAEVATLGGSGITDMFRRELEAFRMYGFSGIPYTPGPKIA
jgi:hypothetical protein